jgi:NADH-quinone oxidoreductase subunit G
MLFRWVNPQHTFHRKFLHHPFFLVSKELIFFFSVTCFLFLLLFLLRLVCRPSFPFSFFSMGALTNKPFSFLARPWESFHVNSFDSTDALLKAIRLDIRSGAVIRILPRLLPQRPSSWTNDRTRMLADGFSRQRLALPSFKTLDTRLNVSWSKAIRLFLKFFSFGFSHILSLLGPGLPFLHSVLFKHFFHKLGLPTSTSHSLSSFSSFPIQPSYYQSFPFKNDTVFFLLNADLPTAFPSLHATLAKASLLDNVKIFSFGVSNAPFISNLGSTSRIQAFFQGKVLPLDAFLRFKNIIFLNGGLPDNQAIILPSLLQSFSRYFLQHGLTFTFLDLFHNLKELNNQFLNFFPSTTSRFTSNILYLNQADLFKVLTPNPFSLTIFQGFHGDLAASKANLLFPTPSLYEDKFAYAYDLFGANATFSYAFPGPLDARSYSSFFSFFSSFLNVSSFTQRISKRFHFLKLFSSTSFLPPYQTLFSTRLPFFQRTVHDFFQIDATTRVSPLLALRSSSNNSIRTSHHLFL